MLVNALQSALAKVRFAAGASAVAQPPKQQQQQRSGGTPQARFKAGAGRARRPEAAGEEYAEMAAAEPDLEAELGVVEAEGLEEVEGAGEGLEDVEVELSGGARAGSGGGENGSTQGPG